MVEIYCLLYKLIGSTFFTITIMKIQQIVALMVMMGCSWCAASLSHLPPELRPPLSYIIPPREFNNDQAWPPRG